MIDRTIAHYQLIEKLGEGGMGVVYKARDLHLDRLVAIKVLPPEMVADPERKLRFVHEARAASALNHPNIITVHDVASAEGRDFIVLEYVEGKTLTQLIGRKGLKLNEVLGYAAQIADGLAKAHSAGIVHRDLKPSNIMVRDDGVVKILDFGLAKLTEDPSADEFAATQTAARTGEPRTEMGAILGTVAYMSPEQAEGKKVDPRSDIFSFGAVLYEMLTGRQAFRRETRLATLAAITSEDPAPASEILEALPPQAEEVLMRCLRKDPQRRWQSASDLKVVLQDLKDESESGKLTVAALSPVRKRTSGLLVASAGILVILSAATIWWFAYRPSAPEQMEITRLTFDPGVTVSPAISPDGTLAAYSSDRGGDNMDIWVQQIPGGKPVRLTNNPADDGQPSFSPDGSQIVFRSQRDGGGLFVVETLGGEIQGGEARKIADRGLSPQFSPDGAFISYIEVPASLDRALRKMYLLSTQGGVPKPFQQEFSCDAPPVWSPDGKDILFSGRRAGDADSADWWIAPVEGGPAVRTGARRSLSLPLIGTWDYPCTWVGDSVYYLTGSSVEGINALRVRISPRTWQVDNRPEPVTSGTGMQFGIAVARNGRMLFCSMHFTMNIWGLDATPDRGTISGEPQQITSDQTAKWSSFISRDGSRLAYVSFAGQHPRQTEIRVRDMSTGRETARSGSTLTLGNPVLSADGSVLGYGDRVADAYRSFVASGGAASGREICKGCAIVDFFSDPDSALIEYIPNMLVRQNLATGSRTTVLERGASTLISACLSYDDRWFAFAVGRPDGKVGIYIAPVRSEAVPEKDWILIYESDRYLRSPRWSPNGNVLYYLSERDGRCAICAQRIDAATKKPLSAPFVVFRQNTPRRIMNLPTENGALGVAPDRLIFYMAEAGGNIYLAQPKPR